MKPILLMIFLYVQHTVFSQQLTASEKELANTENSFAGLSKSANTRDAFVAYLSDSTVMFNKGNPVIGKKEWESRKPDSSLLFWWPVFIGLSKDGSLGFSTGPWEWSRNREQLPQAFGYYATIWKKEKNGSWKMGVDLGTSFAETQQKNPALRVSPVYAINSSQSTANTKGELFTLDQFYNSKLQARSFLAEYFTADGHLLRPDNSPASGPTNFSGLIDIGQEFTFKTFGGDMAGSGDLGYTYGAVTFDKPTGDKKEKEIRNFLRVWKKSEQGWKIVLDVISRE